MDINVYSGFFRELRPYKFSELQDELHISDEEYMKTLIRAMKAYDIIRSAKSELKDYENLSDQDLIFTDGSNTSDNVVYVFKFVGIVLLGNTVIKCYPKYIDSEDKTVIEDSLILALKALEKYNTNKEQHISLYDGNDTDKTFNKLETGLFLLQDYFAHDLYSNQEEIIEINGEGEILFDRTVEQSMAIIQDDQPYYVELQTRRSLDNDSDYFRQLHKCILNECSKDLDKTGLLDIFGLSSVEFPESQLEDFGEKEYILSKITSELGNQFITHRVTLLKTLYTYVESEYGNDTNLNLDLLGTTSFNLVWEKACASIFGDVLDLKIKDLKKIGKLNKSINSSFNEELTILGLIEKVRWEINEKILETKETLEPDIISIDEKAKRFFILDGKYYIIKQEDNRIFSQPGIQDVVKQFAYQKAYQTFTQEFAFTSIGNAFLIPQLYSLNNRIKKDIYYEGTVQLDLMQFYAFKLLAPIQVLALSPKYVFDNYVFGKNCEKDLYSCEMELNWTTENVFESVESENRINNSMFGFLRKEYFVQLKDRINNGNLDSFPFYFYAQNKHRKQFAVDTKVLDSKFFIGYCGNRSEYIIGDVSSDLQLYGKDKLASILKRKGFEKNDYSAISYYCLNISNPRIVDSSEIDKYGIDIDSINKNCVISRFAPKVLDNV